MKLEQRRQGIGTGAIVAAVIVVILIAAAAYFIFAPSSTSTTSTSTTTTSSPSTTTTSSTSSSTTSTTSTSSSSSSSVTAVTVILPQGVGSDQSLNFQPSSLTVVVGVNNTITFEDQDTTAPHNVWFTSVPTGATNPNTAAGQSSFYELTTGQSVTFTLTTPGTYDFECQFHSGWMQGVITVIGSGTTTSSSSSSISSSSSTTSTSSSSSTTSSSSSSSTTAGVTIVMPQGAASGMNFQPSTVTVVVGVNNTITFDDQDSLAPHNVWFTSVPTGATNPNTAAGQSSGYELLKGQSVTFTLTTPGTYTFECQFHSSWMLGSITVLAA